MQSNGSVGIDFPTTLADVMEALEHCGKYKLQSYGGASCDDWKAEFEKIKDTPIPDISDLEFKGEDFTPYEISF